MTQHLCGCKKSKEIDEVDSCPFAFCVCVAGKNKRKEEWEWEKGKKKKGIESERERIIEGKSRREMRKEILIKMETISS